MDLMLLNSCMPFPGRVVLLFLLIAVALNCLRCLKYCDFRLKMMKNNAKCLEKMNTYRFLKDVLVSVKLSAYVLCY